MLQETGKTYRREFFLLRFQVLSSKIYLLTPNIIEIYCVESNFLVKKSDSLPGF
eukprot:TRINITY_DN1700_c0_g1_i1.p2 TRINITY_DN1700_c0_g1~~TRINITY_DN1700_c0_g1_i1.p2  ORF type:complete len:54 (-),score=2.98 TRINITY_DN1700_c0_g1_i1:109-270(-)